ncbi:hypothetical protein GIB67_043285 [Kingdonia uniflora]|uniref:F-box domain-containing protein n=1 Tax=Kingdonia uniflora TaxID=39325 RepID=A0A7J7M2E7_9MAGN|nr:hypothetical protein GIB67_043285 [Kingdonia uniflora]
MDGINCRTIGFSLLPSELIQDIFLRLALPEIHRVKSVSKTLTPVITCKHFLREYNVRSVTDSWVFVYKKRSSLRDSVLYGFTDRLNRWFSIPVYGLLSGVVPPGDDLYFLTASGDFFLFASNRRQELIAVNFSLNTVKKIPSSLLGPRGTSSWRRSGLKLISGPPGSDRFRFLFAERYMNRPVLFEYNSESDTWRIVQTSGNQPCGDRSENVYLSVTHHGSESVILGVRPQLGLGDELPVILRPRFDNEGPRKD